MCFPDRFESVCAIIRSYSHALLCRDRIDGSLRAFIGFLVTRRTHRTVIRVGLTLCKQDYTGGPFMYITFGYVLMRGKWHNIYALCSEWAYWDWSGFIIGGRAYMYSFFVVFCFHYTLCVYVSIPTKGLLRLILCKSATLKGPLHWQSGWSYSYLLKQYTAWLTMLSVQSLQPHVHKTTDVTHTAPVFWLVVRKKRQEFTHVKVLEGIWMTIARKSHLAPENWCSCKWRYFRRCELCTESEIYSPVHWIDTTFVLLQSC